MISTGQIRAARAMLNWSQDDLARESGLSIATIRNIEGGNLSPRSVAEIRKAFERKGFEFCGLNSVSRRLDEHKIFAGPDSCHQLYDDILSTAQQTGGDITAIFQTQEILAHSLGVTDYRNLSRLEKLHELASMKCLLSDVHHSTLFMPIFQFRLIPQHPLAPLSSFIYGDKTALVIRDGNDFTHFVMRSVTLAQAGRKKFAIDWEGALPLAVTPSLRAKA